MRPPPPAPPRRRPESAADATSARRSRARDEPLDVSWVQTEPYAIVLVRNPLHGTRYLAFAPDLAHLDDALCTCPDFARRGPARCKHLEAIRLWRDAHPEELTVPARGGPQAARIWTAVDAARGSDDRSVSAKRREGRLLVEGSTAPRGP